jgi:CBS domain-containing protein
MADLVADLPERSLLVFGAPGGSWFHRRLFGPGARLRSQADVGAVVVKSAPRRVFQVMGEPAFVAPMMQAGDTLKLRDEQVLAVADAGRLVGIVRRPRLLEVDPSTPVGQLMDEPVAVEQTDSLEAAMALRPLFGTDPIPVVDSDQRLVGGLDLADL